VPVFENISPYLRCLRNSRLGAFGMATHPLITASDFYITQVEPLPIHVIIPPVRAVQVLVSLFGSDAEYVLSKIIEAVSDKVSAQLKATRLADEIYHGLTQGAKHRSPQVLDYMITVEQAALDIRDALSESGCYIYDRWLPYMFEHIVPGGSLLLQRATSFEEFCDELLWSNSIGEYHPPPYE